MSPRRLVLLAMPALLQCVRDDAFPEADDLDVDQLDDFGAPVEPPGEPWSGGDSSEALAPDISSAREVGALQTRVLPVGPATATFGWGNILSEMSASLKTIVHAGAAMAHSSGQGLLKRGYPLDETSKTLCSSAGPTCKYVVDTLHTLGEERLKPTFTHTWCLGHECIQQNLDKCKGVLPFLDYLLTMECGYLKCAEGGEGCKAVVDYISTAFLCKEDYKECIKKMNDRIGGMCSAGSRECLLNHNTTCGQWVSVVDDAKAAGACDLYTCKAIGGDCGAAVDKFMEESPSSSPCFINSTLSCEDAAFVCNTGKSCVDKHGDACGILAKSLEELESADYCKKAICASQGAGCERAMRLLDNTTRALNKDDKTFLCGEGNSCMEKSKDVCKKWNDQVWGLCPSAAPSTTAPVARAAPVTSTTSSTVTNTSVTTTVLGLSPGAAPSAAAPVAKISLAIFLATLVRA